MSTVLKVEFRGLGENPIHTLSMTAAADDLRRLLREGVGINMDHTRTNVLNVYAPDGQLEAIKALLAEHCAQATVTVDERRGV